MNYANETVAILLTCHNRKNTTLSCLKSICDQRTIEGLNKKVILVDDGSTDGTAEAIKNQYPDVQIISGDGNLFWNHGMRLAMETAMFQGYDYYMWLNDDVKLQPNALYMLHSTYKKFYTKGVESSIVVGSTQDQNTGEVTYGGSVRCSKWHPLRFRLKEPEKRPIPCDNFHGNIVFIPNVVTKKLGNLDSKFHHQGGDHDYALRAKKKGAQLWLAPGYLGYCSKNIIRPSWKQQGLTLRKRIEIMIDTKCLPWRTRMNYIKRHGGILWPIWWVAPYIKALIMHNYYNLNQK